MTTTPRIVFDTTPFELSHGRSPRGRGSWCFCPFHLRNANDYMNYTLFSPSMNYAEAKCWAKGKIAELRSIAQDFATPYNAEVWAVLG
jgi:hypothetical protein